MKLVVWGVSPLSRPERVADEELAPRLTAKRRIMFNLGPNTITFMLPAEMFETRYRATFYGLAAAAGKVGAIVTQVINVLLVQNKGNKEFSIFWLSGMVPAMLIGAAVTWFWVPEVQEPFNAKHFEGGPITSRRKRLFNANAWKRPNRTLEDIAEDPSAGQKIGVRKRLGMRRQANDEEAVDNHAGNGGLAYPMR
jgi:MFS transporter, PHS family, inorganic phosphate transporter